MEYNAGLGPERPLVQPYSPDFRFRGGAVARWQELSPNGERAIDEAASWDMRTWTVDRATRLGAG